MPEHPLTPQEQNLVDAYRAADIARRVLDRAEDQLSRAKEARDRAHVACEQALADLRRVSGG